MTTETDPTVVRSQIVVGAAQDHAPSNLRSGSS